MITIYSKPQRQTVQKREAMYISYLKFLEESRAKSLSATESVKTWARGKKTSVKVVQKEYWWPNLQITFTIQVLGESDLAKEFSHDQAVVRARFIEPVLSKVTL